MSVLIFEKPIIWVKRRLTGLRNHGRPVLIAQDIMEVGVTRPQADVVNILTMITTSLQRNTVHRMSTTNATHPPHHGTTVTTAAPLADTALPATPQKTPGPLGLPGHTPKTHLAVLMAGAPHLYKEGAVQTHVLPREALGTQETSLVTPVITMALQEGVRGDKEIAQHPGDRIPLQQGLNHSNSRPLRAILDSSGQVGRTSRGGIQALSHLMVPNMLSSSTISRMHSSSSNNSNNSSSSSNRCSKARYKAVSLYQQVQGLDQHSSSQKLAKLQHRDDSLE